MSGVLGSITLLHWTLISGNIFTSSFSTAPPGTCLYHFSVCYEPFFLQWSQWNFFATLSCHLLYSFWANFLHPLTNCCTLLVFFPNNLSRWGGGGVIDVFDLVLYINWTNGFFMCSKWQRLCSNLDNHYQVLSLSSFPGISLIRCPCIFVSSQFCLSSCFLNYLVVTLSSVLIFSAAATPLMNFSSELAT